MLEEQSPLGLPVGASPPLVLPAESTAGNGTPAKASQQIFVLIVLVESTYSRWPHRDEACTSGTVSQVFQKVLSVESNNSSTGDYSARLKWS